MRDVMKLFDNIYLKIENDKSFQQVKHMSIEKREDCKSLSEFQQKRLSEQSK
jgi:hypothetical protein